MQLKKTKRKLILAVVPIGVFAILLWSSWLSPRLMFHGIAGGKWRDYSDVRYQRIGDDALISFRPVNEEALQQVIDRLGLSRGMPLGNMEITTEGLLRDAGYIASDFSAYGLVRENTARNDLLFLYVGPTESIIVRINL
jgi:hypothetical protein